MVALMALAWLTGGTVQADTVTESFEEWGASVGEGWTLINDATYGNSYSYDYVVSDDCEATEGKKTLWNSSHSAAGYTTSPMIVTPSMTGTLMFKFRKYNSSSSTKGYMTIFEYNEESGEVVSSYVWLCKPNGVNEATSKYQQGIVTVGDTPKRYAIYLSDVCIDEMIYTPAAAPVEGAGLAVSGYVNGATVNFGMVDANAKQQLTLLNPGTAEVNVTIAATGGYAVSPTSVKIAAKGKETITLVAPAATAEGQLTLTPAEAGVETIVLNLSCFVKDPNKMFVDFSDNALPADWETVATGSYAGGNAWAFSNGYAEYANGSLYGRYYDQALVSPLMIFTEGEKVLFKAKKAGSYDPYMVVEYYDGSTWTATAEGAFTSFGADWASYEVTIPAAAKKIRFNGCCFAIDDIYGGQLDATPRPKLAVKDIENGGTLSWGYSDVPAGSEKVITLENTGKADLNVTLSATDDFTVTPAEGTVKAGETLDVTIGTPAHDGNGVLTIKPAAESGLDNYTITLTSYYKEPKAEMVIDIEDYAVDFGVLNEEKTQEVTVKNVGDAELTATIANDNTENFEVTPAELTVAAGESKTFAIKYKYVEGVYGKFNATITVTPNAGSAVKMTATATSKNPYVWTEDFEGGVMPNFWVNQGWTIATVNDSKMAQTSSTSNNVLTTPRLQAKKDEVLSFDVYYPWSDEALTIEYSADDMESWETFSTFKPADEEQGDKYTKHFEFTAPADGNYYLRFTGRYASIDNFEGFNLALPDHILAITASTIPNYGIKEGVHFRAFVTLSESRGVNEEVTAKVYMNDVVIGTQTATVEANGTKQVVIDCLPTLAGENVEMYIEVTYAGGTLATEKVTRSVEASLKLALSEDEAVEIVAGTYDLVTLNYTLKEGWNTICLPFMLDANVLGDDVKIYTYSNYTDGVLSFTSLVGSQLAKQTPYIVYAPAEKVVNIALSNATIYESDADVTEAQTTHNGVTLQGCYAPYQLTADNYGITNKGKIKKGTGDEASNLKGYRAYFTGMTSEARIAIETTTGIQMLSVDRGSLNVEGVYDLNGRRVTTPTKGIVIVNGVKVVKD